MKKKWVKLTVWTSGTRWSELWPHTAGLAGERVVLSSPGLSSVPPLLHSRRSAAPLQQVPVPARVCKSPHPAPLTGTVVQRWRKWLGSGGRLVGPSRCTATAFNLGALLSLRVYLCRCTKCQILLSVGCAGQTGLKLYIFWRSLYTFLQTHCEKIQKSG